MGDEQRRERKQFEPPPWEKEAFDALAAKRAEQEKAEELLRGAVALDDLAGSLTAPVASTVEEAGLLTAALLRQMAEEDAAKAAEAGAEASDETAAVPDGASKAPDDKIVAAMMLELSHEETSDGNSAKVVAWVASGVTAVLGLAMVIAGLTLATKAQGQNSAVIGSAVLTVFGLIFGGMAVWVWMSSNRVRGR